jgi:ribosomal-protein-alanine N-acetyltransferase
MDGLRLREWRAADAPQIAVIVDGPQAAKWSHIGEVGAERWIEEQRAGHRGPSLAICTNADQRVLGKAALRLPGQTSAATTCEAIRPEDGAVSELSYWVLPHARGRGVASAGAAAMLDLARGMPDVQSVVLDVETDNAASIRVAERVGATRREPTRVEHDRAGIPRTPAVYIIGV